MFTIKATRYISDKIGQRSYTEVFEAYSFKEFLGGPGPHRQFNFYGVTHPEGIEGAEIAKKKNASPSISMFITGFDDVHEKTDPDFYFHEIIVENSNGKTTMIARSPAPY